MFAEDVGLLPDQLFTQDAGGQPPRPEGLRGERAHPVRRDGEQGRQGRLHRDRLVQRRPVRGRPCAAGQHRRHRRAAQGRAPRLVADRPVDPRHTVRARARPVQAQPAGRALHRPREDHDDRRPGDHRAAGGRMGRGAGAGSRRWSRSAPKADEAEAAARRRTGQADARAGQAEAIHEALHRAAARTSACSTRPAARAISSMSRCRR